MSFGILCTTLWSTVLFTFTIFITKNTINLHSSKISVQMAMFSKPFVLSDGYIPEKSTFHTFSPFMSSRDQDFFSS
jgi:hypothetical protein